MKMKTPRGTADLTAVIRLSHQKVHRAVVARVWELFDGGLSPAGIARAHRVSAAPGGFGLKGWKPDGVPK
jgi:hypothetical protein